MTIRRADHIEHVTAFDGTKDLARARALGRFELQAWPEKDLSPDERKLHDRDWLQFIVGLERKPAQPFAYYSVTSYLGRN